VTSSWFFLSTHFNIVYKAAWLLPRFKCNLRSSGMLRSVD